ncbi:helix-turn-helix domain-containing protein [Sphingobium sp. TCM1]|uniref:helix-turn-helix domain-containing protein n=2 Tax=unclassified Sphingobium TaxID=2611147 RepID=UPI0007F385A7|nr:response regulator transcription factor [Sphingobium sp. TCM1]OAN56659.1 helix-turn-helix transcriptional regulator [Sphingobium sp. TCM1]
MHFATDLHDILDHPAHGTPEPAPLTPTQMKVLHCVHSGLLNKQIAYELGMAEATVKVHMTALMRKLNVRNRTQAAITARNLGWLRPALGRATD